MKDLDGQVLDDTCSSLLLHIKPFVDVKNDDVAALLKHFTERGATVATGPKLGAGQTESPYAADLSCAVRGLQQIIGSSGELIDKVMNCSIEKLPDVLSLAPPEPFGAAYAQVETKKAAWLKTLEPGHDMSDEAQTLSEQVNCLVNVAKTILACHSGCGWLTD